MKTPQNVQRETWHKQRDSDATDCWLQRQLGGPPAFSSWTDSLCFSSARHR